MKKTIRTERTLSLRDQALTAEQQAVLALLRTDPRYQVLLDVMERACIEQETNLLNCPSHESDRILAEHSFSKAMWQVFTYIQRQVENAYNQRAGKDEDAEEVTLEEQERRNILST